MDGHVGWPADLDHALPPRQSVLADAEPDALLPYAVTGTRRVNFGNSINDHEFDEAIFARCETPIPGLAPRLVDCPILVVQPVIDRPSGVEKRAEVVLERLLVANEPRLLLAHLAEEEIRFA